MSGEEKVNLLKNLARLMECIECGNDPDHCGCTEEDEDENGYCKRWRRKESWVN